MVFRHERHKDGPDLAQPEGDQDDTHQQRISDDEDGADPERQPRSDDSGDEDPAEAARKLREEIEMVRDLPPDADGVEAFEPGEDAQTTEQRLSAAHSGPAAGDFRSASAAGTFEDGVRVNPRYNWSTLPNTVSAAHVARFKENWRMWRQEAGALRGDGVEFE